MSIKPEIIENNTIYRRFTLSAGMTGFNSLLVGQIGDWTWEAVQQLCSINPYRAKNASGNPSYLSFFYYHILGNPKTQLKSFKIGDEIEVITSLYQCNEESLHTLHQISIRKKTKQSQKKPVTVETLYEKPDKDCVYIENFNRWISRSNENSNERLIKSAPQGFKYKHLPLVSKKYPPWNFYQKAIETQSFLKEFDTYKNLTGKNDFSMEYKVDLTQDINGVGLLYFASYFTIFDKAIWNLWKAFGGTDKNFLARKVLNQKICYLGNADYNANLLLSVQLWQKDKNATKYVFNIVIRCENNNKIIAISTIETLIDEKLKKKQPLSESNIARTSEIAKEANTNFTSVERIIKVLAHTLKLDKEEIKAHIDFREFGLNSVTIVAFIENLKNEFQIKEEHSIDFSPSTFFEFRNIHKLALFLNRALSLESLPSFSLHKQDNTFAKRETVVSRKDIAIIGMDCRFPGAENYKEFWQNLIAGKDSIQEIPRDRWDWHHYFGDPLKEKNKTNSKWGGFIENVDKFDASFFKISPKEAELMDPQQRIFLESVWKGIEDSGYNPYSFAGKKVGLFVGVSNTDYLEILKENDIEAYTATGSAHSILANRISYLLDLRGPSQAIDTACSSSLVALYQAVRSLQLGESELAIAGGVNLLLSPNLFISYAKAGMLSTDGRCKTFSKEANGYVRSEGVGVVLLKPLEQAIHEKDNIIAVVKGVAFNHGGRTHSLTAPNPETQADLISGVYEEAQFSPESVSYVEAHGTGTKLGDPIEFSGLKKAFDAFSSKGSRKNYCGLGSVKTNIGHLESAAGIAGLIKIILCMQHQKLPKNIHFTTPNPHLNLENSPFYIVKETKDWLRQKESDNKELPLRAGLSSFGSGGANAHVLLEEYCNNTLLKTENATNKDKLILISAKSAASLKKYVEQLQTYLEKEKNISLESIAYTLQVGRESMAFRLAFSVKSQEELIEKLQLYLSEKASIKGFFQGKISQKQTHLQMLHEDRDFQKTVQKWIVKEKINKLAEFWVNGLELDWNLLYQNTQKIPQKIPLPTYPFEKEKHWFSFSHTKPTVIDQSNIHPLINEKISLLAKSPSKSLPYKNENRKKSSLPTYPFTKEKYWIIKSNTPSTVVSQQSILHALIDENVSSLKEHCFKKTFTGREFYLKDHLVLGNKMLPGVAYLEMARKAGELVNHSEKVVELGNIIWTTPIKNNGKPKEAFIALQPNGKSVHYEVRTFNKEKAVIHFQGKLTYENGIPKKKKDVLNLEKIQKRTTHKIKQQDIYKKFAELGLNYGTAFQLLKWVKINEGEALGLLQLSSELAEKNIGYMLHPSIMDGALQTIAFLEFKKKNSTLALPFSLDGLLLFSETPSLCYAYAKHSSENSSSQTIKKYDIFLMDSFGEIAVEFKGFSVRAMQKISNNVSVKRNDSFGNKALGTSDNFINNRWSNSLASQTNGELEKKTEKLLKEILAETLKLPVHKINSEEPLEKYGIDSLMIGELNEDLKELFGELPKTLFFEYQTIAELVPYFAKNHSHQVQQHFQVQRKAITSIEKIVSNPEELKEIKSLSSLNVFNQPKLVEKNIEKIAIIGLSGRYPMANNLSEFWENLKSGKDCIEEIPASRWDWKKYYDADKNQKGKIYSKWGGFLDNVSHFDPSFFSLSPKEVETIDPQERLFLETVWHTLEDAGYTRESLKQKIVGVYVGVMWGHYQLYSLYEEEGVFASSSYASIANRVSYYCNFSGPSMAVDTMCSSSLTAIHLACNAIKSGDCEVAIAGGVNLTLHPEKYLYLSQGKFASSNGKCKSFGEGGDGYVPGEGVGAILLKPLEQAITDGDSIYGTILSSSVNHGGKTNGYTVPNPNAQEKVIRKTLQKSKIALETINYIETHGTGTSLGDPIEIAGLSKVFNETNMEKQYCAIGSVKSNIGHLESAAGIAALTKVLLQMKHKTLVPSIHSETLNPNINFKETPFYVQQKLESWESPSIIENNEPKKYPRRAGISSFGAGGANAHLIIEEYSQKYPSKSQKVREKEKLFLLSAKTEASLKEYVKKIVGYLEEEKGNDLLEDIAFTLQIGREPLEIKLAILAKTKQELLKKLNAYLQEEDKAQSKSLYFIKTSNLETEKKEKIEAYLTKEKLKELMFLWLQGTKIDWSLLPQNQKRRKLSLPTYPFAKKSYWIHSRNSTSSQKSSFPLNSKLQKEKKVSWSEKDLDSTLKRKIESIVKLEWFNEEIVFVRMEEREHKNMFSQDLLYGLQHRFAQLEKASKLKVVILTGYDNIFCMGGTQEELLSISDKKAKFTDLEFLYTGLLEFELPIISAMQGHAYGGGLIFGLYGDIILMSEECVYAANFTKYGFTPGLGATLLLKEKLSSNLANEMMFTAKSFRGEELKTRGTSVRFYKQTEVLTEALFLAQNLSEKPRKTLKVLKQGLAKRLLDALPQTIAEEIKMHQITFSQPEVKQNIEKFFNKTTTSLATKEEISKPLENKPKILKQQILPQKFSSKAIEKKLQEMMAQILYFKVEEVTLDRTFNQLGVDSVTSVEIIRDLNKEFHLNLDAIVFYDYPTIKKFASFLSEQLKKVKVSNANNATDKVDKNNLKEKEFSTKLKLKPLHLPTSSENNGLKQTTSPNNFNKQEKISLKPSNSSFHLFKNYQQKQTTEKTIKNTLSTKSIKSINSVGSKEARSTDVAIIGAAGRFPEAQNMQEFWQNLSQGKNSIREIPAKRWNLEDFYHPNPETPNKSCSKWGGFLDNIEAFDPLFFKLSPSEAEIMDPEQRLFLEECWKALEDAAYTSKSLQGKKCGVFVGVGQSDYPQYLRQSGIETNAQMLTGNNNAVLAARISYHLNLKGPSLSINTACSSSLVAVHLACQSILNGESEMALAGGVQLIITPEGYIIASKAGMLSASGQCKTFDDSADGIVLGEGVGVVVLKSLHSALKDKDQILGVIKGSGINQDGQTNGITAPSASSQTKLEQEIYHKFKINPSNISYVEAHGTGTKLGDPIEIKALTNAFKEFTNKKQFCAIGSLKTNIGHTILASGIASLLKVLLAMKYKKIPPSLNFETENKHISFKETPFYVNNTLQSWRSPQNAPRLSAISSFGISGTNCHLVLEEFHDSREKRVETEKEQLILLSARTKVSLHEYALNLKTYLSKKENQEVLLRDVAYTLKVGRDSMDYRLAFVVRSKTELLQKLAQYLTNDSKIEQCFWGNSKVKEDTFSALKNLIIGKQEGSFLSKHLIKQFQQEGKLADFAKIWTTGFEIDWELFSQNQGEKISLPTYPFQKEKYWVIQPKALDNALFSKQEKPQKLNHPLVNETLSVFTVPLNTKWFNASQKLGKISLPTYSFDQKKYWIPSTTQTIFQLSKRENLQKTYHPLVNETLSIFTDPLNTKWFNASQKVGKISLPTYSFDQKKYWIPSTTQRIFQLSKQENWQKFNHPLVNEMVSVFTNQLNEKRLNASRKAGKISLPTYSFDQKKYWISPSQKQNSAVLEKETKSNLPINDVKDKESGKIEYLILEKLWKENNISNSNEMKLEGTLILLLNEKNPQLQSILEGFPSLQLLFVQQNTTIQKKAKSASTFFCNTIEQWGETAQAITNQFQNIVAVLDFTNFASSQTNQFLDFCKIKFLQTLISNQKNNSFHLLHFTKELKVFQSKQPNLNGATFAGLIRMLGAEYQKVLAKTIDLDFAFEDASSFRKVIANEFNETESEICYRQGKRYIPSLEKIFSDNTILSQKSGLKIDVEKVYIITGGVRGIGFQLAQYLIQKGAKKLVLMGKILLPEQKEWERIIQEKSAVSEIIEKLTQLKALEQSGVQLKIYTGNLTEKTKLQPYFSAIRKELGEIGGVFHCAGLISSKNAAFIHKDIEEFEMVMEPKVKGLETLHTVFSKDSLDFFILFSSVSAQIPSLGIGLVDYASANAFMDHYAQYQFHQGNTYYKSIAWPSWKTGGMGEVKSQSYQQLGLLSLEKNEGFSFLDELLTFFDKPYLIPVKIASPLFNSETLLFTKREKKAVSKPSIKAEDSAQILTRNLPEHNISWLRKLFAKELKIAEKDLDIETNFGEFGVDSILIVELVKKIETELNAKLEPSIFLEHPSLKKLAQHLEQNYPTFFKNYKSKENFSAIYVKENNLPSSFKQISTQHKELKLEKIAIIGVGCHFPEAPNKETFWNNLEAGKCSISEIPALRWDKNKYYSLTPETGKSISKWGAFLENIELFDAEYFKLSEKEAIYMDPLERQFLEVGVQTIRDAGYEREELWNKKVGVFVGTRVSNYAQKIKLPSKNSIVGIGQNFIAAHLSHLLNFKGPNLVVDTACSSSLVSIHLACQSLFSGESEYALAGGVDILLDEQSYLLLSEAKALSPDGKCHTFDEKANGFVPGEGCGAVLLKPLSKAINDKDQIYAVIDATAVNNDGHTMGITTPNMEAQKEVIREAIQKGGIDPTSISYVEAHGTGTMIGDPIELKSLTSVFREFTQEKDFCAVGSVKTNIGHLFSAAGIASFIKVLLSLKHQKIPSTLHCDTPNPRFDFKNSPFYPNTSLQSWKPRNGVRRAGISSFGFGGTNAHLILSEYQENTEIQPGEQNILRKPLVPVNFNRKRFWPNESMPKLQLSVPEGLKEKEKNAFLQFLRQKEEFFVRNNNYIVRDHQVYETRILPGVTFLDLIYRTLGEDFPLQQITLKNILFKEAIATSDSFDQKLFLKLSKSNQHWNISIKSQKHKDNIPLTDDFAENLECKFHLQESSLPKSLALNALKEKAEHSFEMEKVYQYARKMGIVHYEFMKTFGTIYETSDSYLIELQLSELAQEFLSDFYLHPAFLDASTFAGLLSSLTLLQQEKAEYLSRPYIPLAIEEFKAFRRTSETCYVLLNKTEIPYGKDSFSFTISLYNEVGLPVALFKNLTVKQIRNQELITKLQTIQQSNLPEKRISQQKEILSKRVVVPKNVNQTELPFLIEKQLQTLIATILKKHSEEINTQTGFYELGLDSTQLLSIVNQLSEQLETSLYPTLLFEYSTIQELARYLAENHKEQYSKILSLSPLPQKPATKEEKFYWKSETFKKEKTIKAAPLNREQNQSKTTDIAIIGVAGKYPKAPNLDKFWENLKNGKDCITEIPQERWDWRDYYTPEKGTPGKSYSKWGGFLEDYNQFEPLFFNISPKEAESMDPQERLFLETAWNTLEDAGYTKDSIKKESLSSIRNKDVGVFVGVMWNEYQLYGSQELIEQGQNITSSWSSSIANRVSYTFGFHGPSLAIDTMCSSSLVAIHLAKESLLKGECNVALAGGVNLSIHPSKYLKLSHMQLLSSNGRCQSFGVGGDGYVPGEGVGAVLLKPLEKAILDNDHIYGVLKGSSINHVGKTSGFMIPSPQSQTNLILDAIDDAQIEPDSINYIEAHSIGSSLGDPIEITGLANAFKSQNKKQSCAIGSVKSNIGHLESASGIAALTKVLLQLKHKTLVPSLHSKVLNPGIDFEQSPFYVQQKLQKWKKGTARKRRAGISSIGAGGTNIHLIIEEYESNRVPLTDNKVYPLFILSAKSETSLKEYVRKHLKFAEQHPEDFASVAYFHTLQTGRTHFKHRLAIYAPDKFTLFAKLNAYLNGNSVSELFYQKQQLPLAKQATKVKLALLLKLSLKTENYLEIAQLWTLFDFDLNLVFNSNFSSKISLPTYPFKREKYWIEEQFNSLTDNSFLSKGSLSSVSPNFLHPLIDENVSTLVEQSFKKNFSGEEFYLKDHLIQKNKVLPGGVYLEFARVAGELATKSSQIRKLKNIEWLRPFQINEKAQDLFISLSPHEDFVGYEIRTINSKNKVLLHGKGELVYQEKNVATEAFNYVDLEALKERTTATITSEQLYPYFESAGFHYGPTFQTLKWIKSNEVEALGKVELPSSFENNKSEYLLHPSLMDGALQTVAGIGFQKNEEFALPFALDGLDIFGEIPPQCYAYATKLNSQNEISSENIKKYNIQLFDETGKIIVQFHGFATKKVNYSSLIATKENKEIGYYRPVWNLSTLDETNYETQLKAKKTHEFGKLTKTSLEGLTEKIQQILKEKISGLLKIEKEELQIDEDLNAYGFDSITFTEFSNILNDSFELELNPTSFYEYNTIKKLSEFLIEEYPQQCIAFKKEDTKESENLASVSTIQEASSLLIKEKTKARFFQKSIPQPIASKEKESELDLDKESVAIIGIDGIFPGASTLEEFWKNLENSKCLIQEIPEGRWNWKKYYGDPFKEENKTKVKWGGFLENVDRFDPSFFNIAPKEAELMDPQQRLLLQCVWKAIEDAGYSISQLSERSVIGLFVGTSSNDYSELILKQHNKNEAQLLTGLSNSMLANRISYLLNLRGPSATIDTLCSSSLVAFHQAVQSIQSKDCDLAVAGGINLLLSPSLYLSLNKGGLLSEDGHCRPFEKDANGFVRAEGCGALLLKPLYQAIEDQDQIYGVVKSSGINHGGRANALTAPNPIAQVDLISKVIEKTKISPSTIRYIETNATGSSHGDVVEINALKKAFNRSTNNNKKSVSFCGLGSLKGSIGHLEAASGIASILKILLAFKNKKLPGLIGFKEQNPYLDLNDSPFYLVKETENWNSLVNEHGEVIPRRAGISSFGLGGTNAHVLLEEYNIQPKKEIIHGSESLELILLSAKSEEQLRDNAVALKAYLKKKENNVSLCDVAYTLRVGREVMEHRLAIIATNINELIKQLENFIEKKETLAASFFQSRNESKNVLAKSIINDKDASEMIEQWLQKKKYKKLAEFWVTGVSIDWSKLGESRGRKVSLPTYCFAKERYWFTQGKENKVVQTKPTSPEVKPKVGKIRKSYEKKSFSETMIFPFELDGQEPLKSMQQYLVQLVAEMIGVKEDELKADTDLMKNGLSSLQFNELTQRLNQGLKLDLSPALFFDYNTIEAFSQYLFEEYFAASNDRTKSLQQKLIKKKTHPKINLEEEAQLDLSLYSEKKIKGKFNSKPKAILMTGATGYVGAYLVSELIEKSEATLYCLIRGKSKKEGLVRLRFNLQKYGIWKKSYEKRINIITGDFSASHFGLKAKEYKALSEEIDSIYHCGAWVNFVLPYKHLKEANVDGTREIIAFAFHQKLKTIHYVSTENVFEGIRGKEKIFEEPLLAKSCKALSGYGQTKWVAERLINQAKEAGLPVVVYRPAGIAQAVSPVSVLNESDTLTLVLLSCIQMKKFPQMEMFVDSSPVDYVAQSIVSLSLSSKSKGKVFHLSNPNSVPLHEFQKMFHDCGQKAELMSYSQWVNEVEIYSKEVNHQFLQLLLPIFNYPLTDKRESWFEFATNRPEFDCTNTLKGLKNTGIKCPKLEKRLILTTLFKANLSNEFLKLKGNITEPLLQLPKGQKKKNVGVVLTWTLFEESLAKGVKNEFEAEGVDIEVIDLVEILEICKNVTILLSKLKSVNSKEFSEFLSEIHDPNLVENNQFKEVLTNVFNTILSHYQPEFVVSMCPWAAKIAEFCPKTMKNIPLFVLVAEQFGKTRMWISPKATSVYCFSNELEKYFKATENEKDSSLKGVVRFTKKTKNPIQYFRNLVQKQLPLHLKKGEKAPEKLKNKIQVPE